MGFQDSFGGGGGGLGKGALMLFTFYDCDNFIILISKDIISGGSLRMGSTTIREGTEFGNTSVAEILRI